MSSVKDRELEKLCSGDKQLIAIVIILDKYDLGGTQGEEPGEYIDEGKQLLRRLATIKSRRELKRAIKSIHREQFGMASTLFSRFGAAANEIATVIGLP